MSSKTEGQNISSPEIKKSLNELETVNFLLGNGAKRLEVFQPHVPALYVFEDMIRGDDGPFRRLSADKRPSLALVHDPIELDFNSPLENDEGSTRGNVYELH